MAQSKPRRPLDFESLVRAKSQGLPQDKRESFTAFCKNKGANAMTDVLLNSMSCSDALYCGHLLKTAAPDVHSVRLIGSRSGLEAACLSTLYSIVHAHLQSQVSKEVLSVVRSDDGKQDKKFGKVIDNDQTMHKAVLFNFRVESKDRDSKFVGELMKEMSYNPDVLVTLLPKRTLSGDDTGIARELLSAYDSKKNLYAFVAIPRQRSWVCLFVKRPVDVEKLIMKFADPQPAKGDVMKYRTVRFVLSYNSGDSMDKLLFRRNKDSLKISPVTEEEDKDPRVRALTYKKGVAYYDYGGAADKKDQKSNNSRGRDKTPTQSRGRSRSRASSPNNRANSRPQSRANSATRSRSAGPKRSSSVGSKQKQGIARRQNDGNFVPDKKRKRSKSVGVREDTRVPLRKKIDDQFGVQFGKKNLKPEEFAKYQVALEQNGVDKQNGYAKPNNQGGGGRPSRGNVGRGRGGLRGGRGGGGGGRGGGGGGIRRGQNNNQPRQLQQQSNNQGQPVKNGVKSSVPIRRGTSNVGPLHAGRYYRTSY